MVVGPSVDSTERPSLQIGGRPIRCSVHRIIAAGEKIRPDIRQVPNPVKASSVNSRVGGQQHFNVNVDADVNDSKPERSIENRHRPNKSRIESKQKCPDQHRSISRRSASETSAAGGSRAAGSGWNRPEPERNGFGREQPGGGHRSQSSRLEIEVRQIFRRLRSTFSGESWSHWWSRVRIPS